MLFCHRTDHVFTRPGVFKNVWFCQLYCLCGADMSACVYGAFSCLLSVTFQLYIWEHAESCKGCHSKVSSNEPHPPTHPSISLCLSLLPSLSFFIYLCLALSIIVFASLLPSFLRVVFLRPCRSVSAFLSCLCRSHNISLLNTPTLLLLATYNAQTHYM